MALPPESAEWLKNAVTDPAVPHGIAYIFPTNVPERAAEFIAKALDDPEAPDGHISNRAAAAVFNLVRRYDATGTTGWE